GRSPLAPGAGAAHARRRGRTGPGRPRMSTVAELMSRRVVAASEDAGFKEIAVVLRANGISALPVVAADRRVIGVVSAADLLRRIEDPDAEPDAGGDAGNGVTARDLMNAPPVTAGADESPQQAAERMRRNGVKRLPVVDGGGRLVGLLSRSDLLRVFIVPDHRIRWLVGEGVLRRGFGLTGVGVSVDGGVVTLDGRVPRRSDVPRLLRAVRRVEGVIGVRSRLGYQRDDLTRPADQGSTGSEHPRAR